MTASGGAGSARSIPLAIEQGLESSRTLVAGLSQAAFDSEWVTLERHTALFRDPTNQQRRFIPLRLDDGEIKDSLRQFAYVDWRGTDETDYRHLLGVLGQRSVEDGSRPESQSYEAEHSLLEGHTDAVWKVALARNGEWALTCGADERIRVWDLNSKACVGILEGHQDLQLEYHAFAIAEETSQRFVPDPDDEFGVQARIELTDLSGKPAGRCLHLQLRPAEVYKSISTNRDGSAVFEVGSEELVDSWQQSESPVILVQRMDDGYIRWMDVTAWLKAKSKNRKTAIKQITFDGEPFTALNLQRMRGRMFSHGNS